MSVIARASYRYRIGWDRINLRRASIWDAVEDGCRPVRRLQSQGQKQQIGRRASPNPSIRYEMADLAAGLCFFDNI
ncbi:hypothetical protein [Rhizobium rhizogenes]|uniref:hypothetical protein n=1 Tax=Rhizobium rhizogenes TaxID=359 RepID=UPI002271FE1A|nr:hypothetical protein [Rhizobium rhizogenes]